MHQSNTEGGTGQSSIEGSSKGLATEVIRLQLKQMIKGLRCFCKKLRYSCIQNSADNGKKKKQTTVTSKDSQL